MTGRVNQAAWTKDNAGFVCCTIAGMFVMGARTTRQAFVDEH
jgi:hypothetical protein